MDFVAFVDFDFYADRLPQAMYYTADKHLVLRTSSVLRGRGLNADVRICGCADIVTGNLRSE